MLGPSLRTKKKMRVSPLSFLKVQVQNWGIFWVAKISNLFWGCLKLLIFLGGEG